MALTYQNGLYPIGRLKKWSQVVLTCQNGLYPIGKLNKYVLLCLTITEYLNWNKRVSVLAKSTRIGLLQGDYSSFRIWKKQLLDYTRDDYLRYLTRLLTGHFRLSHHRRKFGLSKHLAYRLWSWWDSRACILCAWPTAGRVRI